MLPLLRSRPFKVLLPIVVITIITTIGYQFIYAHNPLVELWSLTKVAMSDSMNGRVAPEIRGIEHWLNTPNNQPLTLASLRGKVVLIDFWTYSCINCQRSAPYVVSWDKKYRDQGLVVIGIHTPEFRYEKKIENVQAAMKQLGIEYPVALDNNYKTWRAFQNLYWPAKYLINAEGKIVYQRFGEGAYDITEQKIVELLEQANAKQAP